MQRPGGEALFGIKGLGGDSPVPTLPCTTPSHSPGCFTLIQSSFSSLTSCPQRHRAGWSPVSLLMPSTCIPSPRPHVTPNSGVKPPLSAASCTRSPFPSQTPHVALGAGARPCGGCRWAPWAGRPLPLGFASRSPWGCSALLAVHAADGPQVCAGERILPRSFVPIAASPGAGHEPSLQAPSLCIPAASETTTFQFLSPF